jgi:anti-anti-sigma factor
MSDREPFEIVVAHLDGFVRVKLRGDLDYQATVEQAEALREVTDLRSRVVLDLGQVKFIDSSGLRFLAEIAGAHHGPVRLEKAPAAVVRVLAITGLADMFELDAR